MYESNSMAVAGASAALLALIEITRAPRRRLIRATFFYAGRAVRVLLRLRKHWRGD